ncbi:MAG: hypothetical protein HC924_15615 [Synechococcaceae cyanobacterium SM2_3_2]|nr:hypothetical protein [Synechococcaceae cyanobacterium SM2_3_2]
MDPRLIAAANYRLKEGGIGLKIEVLGSSFWLRGTLPPKPSSGKGHPYQQRYGTGIPANPIGLRHAESIAKEMGAQLTMGTWRWPEERKQDPTAGDWVERFAATTSTPGRGMLLPPLGPRTISGSTAICLKTGSLALRCCQCW